MTTDLILRGAVIGTWDDAAQAFTPTPGVLLQTGRFGLGTDGDVVVSSGTTTLTRTMFYRNLTLSGTGKIVTAGYPLYVSNNLDISAAGAGAISCNGAAGLSPGSSATGAAAPTSIQVLAATTFNVPAASGSAGGTGTTTIGGNGATVGAANRAVGGLGGVGATGGTGVAGAQAAGVGGTIASGSAVTGGFIGLDVVARLFAAAGTPLCPYTPATGGGSGGGDGTNTGSGGGSGGQGGCHLYIAAFNIIRGTNATAGIIQSVGGAGGLGGTRGLGNTGGGGGGAAGPGGFVQIIAGTLAGSTIANAVDVSGGAGGGGGAGTGTGAGGAGTAGGNGGGYLLAVLSPASISLVIMGNSVVGSAPVAPSGTTGGTGGAGAVSRGDL